VKFGESYQEAARRELFKETGISTSLTYIGKITHFDPPENEIVAVFVCHSDEPVIINRDESSAAEYCTKEKVDRIVMSKNPSPWLRDAWKLVRDVF
jgi:isopentenyldiphosphate isomerase